MAKKARFFTVKKRNGRDETWEYFVPGQNEQYVQSRAEQQHVLTTVAFRDWYLTDAFCEPEGVYFLGKNEVEEIFCYPNDEGYEYLVQYLQEEYLAALEAYNS